jgi:hypothetical protein
VKKVLVIDTSVLCVWLQVKGMDPCGPSGDSWDYDRVNRHIERVIEEKATLVLPMATLVETGNHIAQSNDPQRYEVAQRLGRLIKNTADEVSPWAAFTEQSFLWTKERLHGIAENWPSEAARKISIGDFTIVQVANYYSALGYQVEILTGDQGLKALQPASPVHRPRRRSDR